MKMDIFEIDKFIEVNHCKQVTNPIFFAYNKTPNPDGLLSYEIFGYSDDERKNIFAYIDLGGYYIHPIIYNILLKRFGMLRYVITGERYAVILNGKITPAKETDTGAGTGLQFIYDNFEKIDWLNELEDAEIESIDKKTRLRFLKSLKKEEFFITKWLVLPAYYREEAADKSSLGETVNQLYKELLSATRTMKLGFSFDIFGNATKMKIQNTLLNIYQITMGPITGKSLNIDTRELQGNSKNSLLKRHLVGKTLDYGGLTVITAVLDSDAKTVADMPVPFGYCGVTLMAAVGLFKPFFIHGASIVLENFINEVVSRPELDIADYNPNQFSSSQIDKILSRFIKSSSERFDPIVFEYTNSNKQEMEIELEIKLYKSKADAIADKPFEVRALTYTDLIYLTAIKVLKNKHVLVTRHPVTNNKNIYPARVKVMSTARTRDVWIRPIDVNSELIDSEPYEIKNYPYVYYSENRKPAPYYDFVGTTLIGNSVLKAIGGDYDGDTVFLRGLFSSEANNEAEEMIMAKSNVLGAQGSEIRGLTQIGKDCTMSLYELTKE